MKRYFLILPLFALACSLTQAPARMVAAMQTAPIPAPITQTAAVMPSPAPQTCTVSTGTPGGALYLRAGPGTSYSVLDVLTEGQTLTILPGMSKKWIQIQSGDLTGWINSNYCER